MHLIEAHLLKMHENEKLSLVAAAAKEIAHERKKEKTCCSCEKNMLDFLYLLA